MSIYVALQERLGSWLEGVVACDLVNNNRLTELEWTIHDKENGKPEEQTNTLEIGRAHV